LVVGLAAAAGVAIENARLHLRVQEMALVEDRERIARDLHDTVIQRLFATGLSLQGTARLAQRPEVGARIQAAVEDLDLTVKHIRTVIFGLETAAARGGAPGVRERVMTLAGEARGALGYLPDVLFEGAVDTLVDDNAGRELLATLREALSNVARHARATRVEVKVAAGDELVLTVTDDGQGLPADRPVGGLGLRNMASRAENLGGRCEVRSPPGGGAVVEWVVPLRGDPS
ncbi:MAG TPA: ATP-binding protein, partial [Acidimicrobiia bacterium]|nr:ATP-binding protein [Acidimicrobiia bacterium]